MIFETVKTTNRATRLLLLFTILCGGVYPLFVTVLASLFFQNEASGSLIVEDDKVIGSELIAQKFSQPKYFHARPSASDYATLPSGASNQSATSKALLDIVQDRQSHLGGSAPSDLVTASASGLDPHVSPNSAYFQVERIVSTRGLDSDSAQRLRAMIEKMTERSTFGILGKDRINVLRLNIQLDQGF